MLAKKTGKTSAQVVRDKARRTLDQHYKNTPKSIVYITPNLNVKVKAQIEQIKIDTQNKIDQK